MITPASDSPLRFENIKDFSTVPFRLQRWTELNHSCAGGAEARGGLPIQQYGARATTVFRRRHQTADPHRDIRGQLPLQLAVSRKGSAPIVASYPGTLLAAIRSSALALAHVCARGVAPNAPIKADGSAPPRRSWCSSGRPWHP
jgi:hypothetical protein